MRVHACNVCRHSKSCSAQVTLSTPKRRRPQITAQDPWSVISLKISSGIRSKNSSAAVSLSKLWMDPSVEILNWMYTYNLSPDMWYLMGLSYTPAAAQQGGVVVELIWKKKFQFLSWFWLWCRWRMSKCAGYQSCMMDSNFVVSCQHIQQLALTNWTSE